MQVKRVQRAPIQDSRSRPEVINPKRNLMLLNKIKILNPHTIIFNERDMNAYNSMKCIAITIIWSL